jgi:hypothetical protein
MIVAGAGRKALIVTVIGKKGDAHLAVKKLDEIAETLKMM